MSEQTTSSQVFFQPLPENDNAKIREMLADFASKIKIAPTGCWEWQKSKNIGGYGRVGRWSGGKCRTILVHRFIYKHCVEFVPDNLFVLHDCPAGDNPACCNPDHLWAGTKSDNAVDCIEKGRHSTMILSDEQVTEIRRLYRAMNPPRRKPLAIMFGVSEFTIKGIVTGRDRKRTL